MACHTASRKRLRSASIVPLLVCTLLSLLGTPSATANDSTKGTTSRQTHYQVHFEAGLCPVDIAEQVECPAALPICCVRSNAVRCCDNSTSCDSCSHNVVGYEMARGSILIGVMSLVMVLLIGTMVTTGLGRHLAWSLERRRVIAAYRKRLQLRRTAGKRYRDELAATEEHELPDAVACTICCARRMDCGLAPCGHICCCHFCAKRLKECPVCRVTVEQCYELPAYLVSRLVGSLDAIDAGDADVSKGEQLAPGVAEEMRDMRWGAGIEDEREIPGHFSARSQAVSVTTAVSLKAREDAQSHGSAQVDDADEMDLKAHSRARAGFLTRATVPGSPVHTDESSDEDEDGDDSRHREFHGVNSSSRPSQH